MHLLRAQLGNLRLNRHHTRAAPARERANGEHSEKRCVEKRNGGGLEGVRGGGGGAHEAHHGVQRDRAVHEQRVQHVQRQRWPRVEEVCRALERSKDQNDCSSALRTCVLPISTAAELGPPSSKRGWLTGEGSDRAVGERMARIGRHMAWVGRRMAWIGWRVAWIGGCSPLYHTQHDEPRDKECRRHQSAQAGWASARDVEIKTLGGHDAWRGAPASGQQRQRAALAVLGVLLADVKGRHGRTGGGWSVLHEEEGDCEQGAAGFEKTCPKPPLRVHMRFRQLDSSCSGLSK